MGAQPFLKAEICFSPELTSSKEKTPLAFVKVSLPSRQTLKFSIPLPSTEEIFHIKTALPEKGTEAQETKKKHHKAQSLMQNFIFLIFIKNSRLKFTAAFQE